MTGCLDRIDSVDSAPQSLQSECAECEARLRHVLAYIIEKRRRRWIASAAVFLLILSISGIPFSYLYSFTFDVLGLANIGPNELFSPATFGLVLLATTSIPPLTITLLIFSRLRKIYRGY